MLLFIVRHAKAQRSTPTGRDADRPLADRGHRQADWLARTLAEHPSPPARILTSPALRALQTAHPIAQALRLTLHIDDRLLIGTPVSSLLQLLAELPPDAPACIVGHNPSLSDLVAALTHGLAATGFELRTGQAAILDLDHPPRPAAATLRDLLRCPD